MKKFFLILFAILIVAALSVSLVACTTPAGTTDDATVDDSTADDSTVDDSTVDDSTVDDSTTTPEGPGDQPSGNTELVLFEEGKTSYRITYPAGAMNHPTTGATTKSVLTTFRDAFRANGVKTIIVGDDNVPLGANVAEVAPEYEILVGATNRPESDIGESLAFNEAVIRVTGKKVVIAGNNAALTAQAVLKFVETYLPEGTAKLVLPGNLDLKITLDMSLSAVHDISYADMAMATWNAFNDYYWTGTWPGTDPWWWDAAEILETYIDAYEATKDETIKEKMLAFATQFMRRNGTNWSNNEFNDDIMWATIAFTRIYLLTGERTYLNHAKRNFDTVWNRAWDTKLGGGLYWKNDNTTKNSCVNCPAAIAACLIAQATDNADYYEKAIKIMDWEIEWMFEPGTGRVYDARPLKGDVSKWASTYNQGTFIGACTLLYDYTKEDKYLKYADKAADFSMKSLTNGGVLDNGEGNPNGPNQAGDDNRDLIGFKGILTRWLYRYAKYVEDVEILSFLQSNADVAFGNKNKDGLIWTKWNGETPDEISIDDGYYTFGVSTAVALMFNCQQWW